MGKQQITYNDTTRNIELQNLRNRKKLCLVLDLDQTLLHTKSVHKLTLQEYIGLKTSSQKDVHRWKFKGLEKVTKLRPFVREFLEEASKLFDLYIYTNGNRDYAMRMVGFLDPDRVYFGSKIISREDSTVEGLKGLDVVPVDKSGVLILDDTKTVWEQDSSNLVVIKRYDYFAGIDPMSSTRSLSEEGTDEKESSGPLSCALRLLGELHATYFQCYHIFDVNELLGFYRRRMEIMKRSC
ncbi:RNA polymerase II C-terminal domain phosphatase-like [Heracleum sosnowskyi]|uniref:RNA polymerase II C-terminal domain phosphatase-like n=1 Tax=Heracleum sosnowskyi TaxID=360622 RepID=A0AAD8IJR8_9APIA|nr:RNA polymerase II C-terminal domain phosphatase-like [Heracleum sosnowskyi]